MRLEKVVCEPSCRMCHALQPTSSSGNRVDPDTLPPTYPGEKKVNRKLYNKRRDAKRRWPRYRYSDRLKRSAGKCENLDCLRDGPGNGKCVAGVEQCFDWEHSLPRRKRKAISWLCNSLPNMPEAEWKGKIKRELIRGRCRLLCKNCHHLKTNHGMVPRYCPYVK